MEEERRGNRNLTAPPRKRRKGCHHLVGRKKEKGRPRLPRAECRNSCASRRKGTREEKGERKRGVA